MITRFFVIKNITELKNVICLLFEELDYSNREGYQQFEEDFEITINLDSSNPDICDCDYKLKEDGKLYPEDFKVIEDWKEFIPGILYVYFERSFDRMGNYQIKIKDMESLKNLKLKYDKNFS